MRWSLFFALLIVSSLTSCALHAQSPKQNQDVSMSVIPFELSPHNNITIKSILNQKDTLSLMFHTAASSLTITSEASENIVSIDWDAEENINSWGGEASAKFSKSNSLQITDIVWDSLAVWETKNSGPGTDGKFGPNLFSDKVIGIDFNANLIKLTPDMPIDKNGYTKLPIIFENDFMFIEAASLINNTTYENRFLVHSGYGGTILYDDKFVAESNIGAHIEIIDEQELKDSYGYVLITKKGNLPLFIIGDHEFSNLPVGFFEGTIGRQQISVIGMDLIKRFNIIIDSKRENIYLQKNDLTELAYTEF